MDKILITGGLGFIGKSLIKDLHNSRVKIVVIDKLSEQIHGRNYIQSEEFKALTRIAEIYVDDIATMNNLDDLVAGAGIIYHLASETGTGQSMYETSKYSFTNDYGTARLTESILRVGNDLKHLILSSSRSVYGEGAYRDTSGNTVFPSTRTELDLSKGIFNPTLKGTELSPIATKENAPVQPGSYYAAQKLHQENMFAILSKSLNVKLTILRFQNVYGPGQSLSNPYTGILSIFSNLARSGRGFEIFEDGMESRDFVYIADVTAALVASPSRKGDTIEIINIGTGKQISVVEVAEKIKSYFGNNIKVEITGRYRVGDIRHNFSDITKAKDLLKFSPYINFDQGLKLFLDWVRTQPAMKSSYDKSIQELKDKNLLRD